MVVSLRTIRFSAALLLLLVSGGRPVAAGSADNTPQTAHDYQRARYSALHFKPAIASASNADCLACHAEVLKPSVRERSPAGVKAADAKAWYQQVSTYQGAQDTFHRRHLESDFARTTMSLQCTTCHEGHDPRDEHPLSSASARREGSFRLRKSVTPETTCLKCHGQMNTAVMGLPGPWHTSREMFQNDCLTCHAAIRTNRHQVSYLKADAIEAAGKGNGDVCYGCHGGRAWYRTTYPYPRHAWPGMADETPDWAKGRPTESEARFLTGDRAKGQSK
ncbi:hypothetical protein [Zoogloea sp.]|uniref:hypothetical protein n=1 Tax=Zoogloea sp. TaxID=49181 RepID=UPI001AD478F4|nr:hypothetical protein [Zoogloea sp.]MBN8284407.1 hypothetical protein [Zoogloea sp.]